MVQGTVSKEPTNEVTLSPLGNLVRGGRTVSSVVPGLPSHDCLRPLSSGFPCGTGRDFGPPRP